MSALSGGELGPGPGPRPSTARPGCLQGPGVGYLNPLASESWRWELGLVASVVSWSGTSLRTFSLSWWGLFLVGTVPGGGHGYHKTSKPQRSEL